jgi:hypothetical protein
MSLTVAFEHPGLDQLIRHARSFGTECVYETGEQEGLSSADLARLRIELDELEAGRKSKHGFKIGKRRRRSSDETREAAFALRRLVRRCRVLAESRHRDYRRRPRRRGASVAGYPPGSGLTPRGRQKNHQGDSCKSLRFRFTSRPRAWLRRPTAARAAPSREDCSNQAPRYRGRAA